MRIAIPLAQGRLAAHFGHCETFALLDVDEAACAVTARTDATPPPHAPGVLPQWLGEQNVTHVLAGGMGQRAIQLFQAQGIAVVVGAPAETPEALAAAFLAGTLQSGANVCDH